MNGVGLEGEGERDGIEGERVAEGDEFVGAFGGLDGGDFGDGEDIAFGEGEVTESGDGGGKAEESTFCGGGADLGGFVADIDHFGEARGIEMREGKSGHEGENGRWIKGRRGGGRG